MRSPPNRDAGGGLLDVAAGVEVFDPFEERGEVRRATTPAGDAITAAHFGDYSQMGPVYEMLERWCVDNGREPSGTRWEVYGDPDDDPEKTRTDIYFMLSPRGSERLC